MFSPVLHAVFVPESAVRSAGRQTVVSNFDFAQSDRGRMRPARTGRRQNDCGRESDPVSLGTVLGELAAHYGLADEPGPPPGTVHLPTGMAHLPVRTFELPAAGQALAMV